MGRSALTCCAPLEAPACGYHSGKHGCAPVCAQPWSCGALRGTKSSGFGIAVSSSLPNDRDDLREFTAFVAECARSKGVTDVLADLADICADEDEPGQVSEQVPVDQEGFRQFALRLGFRGDARAVFEVLDEFGRGSVPLADVRSQLFAVDPILSTLPALQSQRKQAKSTKKQPKMSPTDSPKLMPGQVKVTEHLHGFRKSLTKAQPHGTEVDAPKTVVIPQQRHVIEVSAPSSVAETGKGAEASTEPFPSRPASAVEAPTLPDAPTRRRSSKERSCKIVAPPLQAMLGTPAWGGNGSLEQSVGYPALDDGRSSNIVLRPLPYQWGAEDRADIPRKFIFRGEVVTVPLLPFGTSLESADKPLQTAGAVKRGTGWQKVRSNVMGGALRTIKDK
eukprot:TRINITY_DN67749_c0_g1_i1.p1 TRINITY_DN67749_c0_g1~~TRINITY_DN67749_c0_g1_i1.p1  ORF type:complete len:392 (-),score=70.89 TRINITY_DN67749_c0_g1_i1:78-1253(-)